MKKIFLGVCLVVALVFNFSTSAFSSYEFYHVAVRDFNGDGNFTYDKDVVRYGFTFSDLSTNTDGWYTIDYDDTSIWISDTLLGVADLWDLQFQEHFENEVGGDNWNWLRSYSEKLEGCDFSTSSVSIPSSALLLVTGIVSLFTLRKRRR